MRVRSHDLPWFSLTILGVLVLSALYLTGNLFVDLLYSYLNPRIRRAGT